MVRWRPLIRDLYQAARGEGLVVQHEHPNKDVRHGFSEGDVLRRGGAGASKVLATRMAAERFRRRRDPSRQAEAVGLSSDPSFPALPSFSVGLESPESPGGRLGKSNDVKLLPI
jgi:hypothetical protein